MDLEFRRERKAEPQKFSNHSFAASIFLSLFRNDYINYKYFAQKNTNFDGEEKTQLFGQKLTTKRPEDSFFGLFFRKFTWGVQILNFLENSPTLEKILDPPMIESEILFSSTF